MACACNKGKTSTAVWLHTVGGTTKTYSSETEARAAAARLGGTIRKQ